MVYFSFSFNNINAQISSILNLNFETVNVVYKTLKSTQSILLIFQGDGALRKWPIEYLVYQPSNKFPIKVKQSF